MRRVHCTTAGRWFSTADGLVHFALQTAGSEQTHQTVLSIPRKLACLLLLMIVLSAQSQACLLIFGAVEQNLGPSTPEDVLAHLSAEAPPSEIRDCITLYDQQRNYSTSKKLSWAPVGILVETMTYLGVPGQDEYVKPTIVHNLICSIQNLFPQMCPICLDMENSPKLESMPTLCRSATLLAETTISKWRVTATIRQLL